MYMYMSRHLKKAYEDGDLLIIVFLFSQYNTYDVVIYLKHFLCNRYFTEILWGTFYYD